MFVLTLQHRDEKFASFGTINLQLTDNSLQISSFFSCVKEIALNTDKLHINGKCNGVVFIIVCVGFLKISSDRTIQTTL